MMNELNNDYDSVSKSDAYRTCWALAGLTDSLLSQNEFVEVRSLLRAHLPLVERVLGPTHQEILRLYLSLEAIAILKDNAQTAKRVLGPAHPVVVSFKEHLSLARQRRHIIDLRQRYGKEPNYD